MQDSVQSNLTSVLGPVIAIEDWVDAIVEGHLFDVSGVATAVGFQWPVALTAAVWCDCVSWSDEDTRAQIPQDYQGRLWDVLYMAHLVMQKAAVPKDCMTFTLLRVPRDGVSCGPQLVQLKLLVALGDAGEPVVTILMSDED